MKPLEETLAPPGPAEVAARPLPLPPTAPDRSRARLAFWAVCGSHVIVDLYPTFILALSVQLQHSLGLTDGQIALLFSLNPVVSGLSQPLLAWLADRLQSPALAPIGLAVGAVCLSSIGHAGAFWQLVALQVLGMAGTGIFHPISAGLAGQSGRDVFRSSARRSARAFALSIFFALGMVGGFLGPISATRINERFGLGTLAFMALPGLIAAATLWWGSRGTPHHEGRRLTAGGARSAADERFEAAGITMARRWAAVGVLFLSNSLLFITNIGLYYLYKRWADASLTGSPESVSSRVGDLIASSQLGMAVGGLALGYVIRPGRERTALFFAAAVTAPVILAMPHLGFRGMLVASFAASLGYFSVIPAFIALGQRLAPHATGLVGSLLMGCGWVVSACAPSLADALIEGWSLAGAFTVFAVFIIGAWGVSLAIPARLVREAAAES